SHSAFLGQIVYYLPPDMGDGDLAVGFLKAIDAGVLDASWGSDPIIKEEVLGVRDARGAWRYLEFGNIPVPAEIKDFHREKIAEREKIEGKKVDYYTAVRDFWSLSKGKMPGLPPYNK
ncbi:hypothetical protein ACFLTB_03135, partial [Chloroflexota bacterium]